MSAEKEKGIEKKVLPFALTIVLVLVGIVVVKEILDSQSLPQSVIVDAGSPLTCNLLENPKTIEYLTALYGCQAPGAYLESIHTQDFTAQYFTSDSQGIQVTYGPNEVKILSIK